MTETDKSVTAKELAVAAEVPYNTIDLWSEQGLLVFRRIGRTRHYPLKKNLRRCKLIRKLQDEGYSNALIRKELASRLRSEEV